MEILAAMLLVKGEIVSKIKMKKIFFICCILILFFSLDVKAWVSISPSSSITPTSAIEGNLFSNSSAQANLTLISPKNNTYLNNQSIPLNYSVSNQQAVWYSLDSGTNITITSSLFFNASDGNHKLYLYANNSAGNTIAKNVNFSVNPILFMINYTKYKNAERGNSTNFSIYSYQEIQNLSNVTFEHTSYGKIFFNGTINLTDDDSDDEINLENYINISSNRIELNSTALPNFNKTATLSLYSLTFTNPRILRDGSVCSSSICTWESYSGNILKFNVTSFSVYSSEETPTEPPTPPGGGGTRGGTTGGAVTIPKADEFSLDTDTIKVILKPGSVITKKFIVRNNLDNPINIALESKRLQEFFILKEQNFALSPGESKEVELDVVIREEVIPNLYLGEIIVKSSNTEKEVLVLIEVESAGALFDVSANVLNLFKIVKQGDNLIANINLYNLAGTQKLDISMEYLIKNSKDETISSEQETIAVETKTGFIKKFTIPEDVPDGKYVLYVKATYNGNGKVASASDMFTIGETSILTTGNILVIILISIIALIILELIIQRRESKKGKIKIDENMFIKEGLIKRGRK